MRRIECSPGREPQCTYREWKGELEGIGATDSDERVEAAWIMPCDADAIRVVAVPEIDEGLGKVGGSWPLDTYMGIPPGGGVGCPL